MSYGYGARPGYPTAPGFTNPRRYSAPPSVHVVAILQYLVGAGLLAVAALIALTVTGSRRVDDVPVEYVRHAGLAVAAVFAFGALFVTVIGRKLQRGRQWARVLTLLLSGVALAGTLFNGLVGTGDRTNVLGGLVLPVLYLILLNTRAARSWFLDRSY